jgi:DNA-binding transcriptional MerR regulator
MIVQQLDLFGGPLRPPKKIKEDDPPVEQLPAEEPAPAASEAENPGIPEETIETTEIQNDLGEPGPLETSPPDEILTEEEEEEVLAEEVVVEDAEPVTDSTESSFTATDDSSPVEEQEQEDIAPKDRKIKADTDEPAPVLQRGRKPSSDPEEEMEMLNVPPDEELFKRQYYSMRETAAMFNVNQSLLRFWENEFDILQPKKNKKGDRYFRPADVKNLVLIYHLLRIRKFTLEGAKEYLNTHQKAGDSFQLIQRLEKLKSFLLELKANL